MARRDIRGLRVALTGASSGIGEHLARVLAQQGARLILNARRADRLGELSQQLASDAAEVHTVVGDITQPEVRGQLLDVAREQWKGLDCLINNAGVGAVGQFINASPERMRRVMEVNFFAPVELTRSALPMLVEGQRPMIVNIASVLAHRAVPRKSEYCASKFALHGFSDSLRAELVALGVDLLLVCPSTTATEFFDSLLENKETLPWLKFGMMSPASVARKTVRAMRRGRQELILTPGGKLLVWCDRLMPGIVNRLVARFA
jgi:short-subunit dehydrogenase